MSRFLSVIPVEKARSVLLGMARKTGEKRVPLIGSAGYVLRTDIISDVDIPGFDRSAVDGYALVAADTVGAGESIPAMLRLSGSIDMGGVSKDRVLPGTCMYIPTGAFLPPGADAVVMIEYCEVMDDEVLISKPAASQNLQQSGRTSCTKAKTSPPKDRPFRQEQR